MFGGGAGSLIDHLLCVACQENVFRVEDPFLTFDCRWGRVHFYADAARDVYVRSPNEPGVCGQTTKKRCTDPWMFLDGENSAPRSRRREDFSRRAASPCQFYHGGLQTCIKVHSDDFSQWADVRGERIH